MRRSGTCSKCREHLISNNQTDSRAHLEHLYQILILRILVFTILKIRSCRPKVFELTVIVEKIGNFNRECRPSHRDQWRCTILIPLVFEMVANKGGLNSKRCISIDTPPHSNRPPPPPSAVFSPKNDASEGWLTTTTSVAKHHFIREVRETMGISMGLVEKIEIFWLNILMEIGAFRLAKRSARSFGPSVPRINSAVVTAVEGA